MLGSGAIVTAASSDLIESGGPEAACCASKLPHHLRRLREVGLGAFTDTRNSNATPAIKSREAAIPRIERMLSDLSEKHGKRGRTGLSS